MELTSSSFDQAINQSSLTLVDFWAPWCGPCLAMAPIVEELAKEWEGKIFVGKLNVDEQSDVAQRYNVMSIPTFLIFRAGKILDQFAGSMSKEQLKTRVESRL